MRALWGIVVFAVALAAQAQDRTLSVSSREAGERIALVIGNSAYKVGPLRNPVNDARAMTRALRKAGFDVDHREDLNHRQMFEATRNFGEKLKPGAVALFYYAGHGLQVRDRNYLIPVEADLKHEDEAPYTSIDASYALEVMNRARTRVNVVILDACRNNPFARSFRSAGRGLAQMEAPSGTLIAYATAPGRVASDGSGEHGLYTQHLLAHLETPGLPVELLFKRVREGVERETNSQQVPWESSSLKGEFSFVAAPAAAAAPARPAAPAAAAAPDAAFELAFWDAIKASSQVADYQAYLTQYPKGRFAVLAKARISTLAPAKPSPPAVVSPAAVPPATAAPQSTPLAAPAPTPVPQASPIPSPAQLAAIAPSAAIAAGAPRVGEKWVYEYIDLWRAPQRGEFTAEVVEVTDREITETVSLKYGIRETLRQTIWPNRMELREWDAGTPEVAFREMTPFALALGLLTPGIEPRVNSRPLEEGSPTPWSTAVDVAQESVTVPAGHFRATKIVLTGKRAPIDGRITSFKLTVWYAPQVKRYVKLAYDSYATRRGAEEPWHRYVHDLVSAR